MTTFRIVAFTAAIALLAILCGCGTRVPKHPVAAQKALLSVWCSTNSSAQERVDAVNKSIALGTDGETVRRLLGSEITWDHFHEGTSDTGGKRVSTADFWRLIYPSPDGRFVALHFQQVPNSAHFQVQFDHAYVYESVVNIPVTLTNSNMKIE